ncbi:MAG: hypothetical protein ACFFDK_15870 [Promethearchaeota archaeon]
MRKNWCDLCKKQVLPIKIFNRRMFFMLFLFTLIGGIIYFIYYLISQGDTCPICKQKKFLRYRKPKEVFPKVIPEQVILQTASQAGTALNYCPYCGTKLNPPGNYCHQCNIKI